MDSVKDYLTPKTFGILAYVCSIIHFLCGVVITSIAIDLNKGEVDKFNCNLGPEGTAAYKTQVDKSCYSRYQQEYNSSLPLYGFVMLSIWFPIIVGVIYSLCVRRRVEEIDSNNEPQTQGEADNQVQNRGTLYVFKFYFFHLAIRVLSGILFSILQYVVIFPSGFDFKYICSLPPTGFTTKTAMNATSFTCENSSASAKQSCWVVVSVFNMGFALIIFMEMIRLRRRPSCDTEFISGYLLRKQCRRVEPPHASDGVDRPEQTDMHERQVFEPCRTSDGVGLQQTDDERQALEPPGASDSVGPQRTDDERQVVQPPHASDSVGLQQTDDERQVLQPPNASDSVGLQQTDDERQVLQPPRASDGVDRLELTDMHESRTSNSVDLEPIKLQECIDFYKGQVLAPSRTTDVFCGPKTGLDDMYIDLVIHTERARHNFSENMERHEIFDVYMKVPRNSIHLKEVKDIFYSNEDTKGNPGKILAVGRPGIGKTVFTEKILHDWAKEVDEFYRGKIAFYFKFRWFNSTESIGMTLKMFLRYGTELSDEKFERIYEYITTHPKSAILIFDGLDEFNGNAECLDQLPPPNDPNICMSGISLFVKLISGRLLPGATVLVTSRPTANEFYSRFTFDRTVEILGFTSDKIEEYVSKFCDNHNRSDLKPKIWNHVKSLSDLLNLCYIPVNCFIVSAILFECLSDPRNEAGALPTTLTEIYQAAIVHFRKHHYRKLDGQSAGDAMKKLQLLAYNGIEHRRLVFSSELFDEQMQRSGLLNSLSNPIYPIQTKFCFTHLTIQEFLAARHVIETFAPKEITKFITSHIKSGKWHLVLQFIAGLLGKKIKIDENCYKDCVLAFTQSFVVKDGVIDLADYSLLFVFKCLKEVDDEEIVKEVCQTDSMNSVMSLNYSTPDTVLTSLSLSDWAAVTSICKYMNKLMTLDLDLSHLGKECHHEVMKLLRTRCIKQLTLAVRRFGSSYSAVEHVLTTLINSKCILNHKHGQLTKLSLQNDYLSDECLSLLDVFFKNGHASHLQRLYLKSDEITSRGVSKLCEFLDNELCPKLEILDLSENGILDEGVRVLCNSIIHKKLNKLTMLGLQRCSLTDDCIPPLCEIITDVYCNLNVLSLSGNKGISDTGLRMLCKDGLSKEHCKLGYLNLCRCSITDKCIPEVREALQDEHCVLKKFMLSSEKFTENGKKSLREIETYEHCKDRGLKICLTSETVVRG